MLVAGCMEDKELLRQAGFQRLININEGKNLTLEEAMRPETALANLRKAGQLIGDGGDFTRYLD
ncbi:MAG: hypothetical protein HUJ99_03515 [Bacteroidaceae bacterium]|nr:hypothetical protein [Bacteroidaceae bacterium]